MTADPLEPVRRRFLARCREDLTLVERALAEPAFRSDPELTAAAHRLAGAGGTFGYPAVSERAGRIDEALRDQAVPADADLDALARALRDILA